MRSSYSACLIINLFDGLGLRKVSPSGGGAGFSLELGVTNGAEVFDKESRLPNGISSGLIDCNGVSVVAATAVFGAFGLPANAFQKFSGI